MLCNTKEKVEVINYIFNNYLKCLQYELAVRNVYNI